MGMTYLFAMPKMDLDIALQAQVVPPHTMKHVRTSVIWHTCCKLHRTSRGSIKVIIIKAEALHPSV